VQETFDALISTALRMEFLALGWTPLRRG